MDEPGLDERGIPNPGSDAARAEGCRCPVLDNNRGIVPPWPGDGWYIHGDCPVHGLAAPPTAGFEG